MSKVMAVNAGSSSLKFKLFQMPQETVLTDGVVERISMDDAIFSIRVNGEKIKKVLPIKDHQQAVDMLLSALVEYHIVDKLDEINAVGHRVLHGGEKYADSVIITDEVVKDIEELTKLGPLHHPGNLAGITAMQEALPGVPMVAVYDTAFHQTMPKKNFLYPTPYEWYTDLGVRKYGFHGTSHKYITTKMQEKLGKKDVNLIICDIGSGASISAVKEGKCYDTTMGLTPLDGLMMGTRSGSIDPSVIEYVCSETGKDVKTITNELNKKSGLLGVSGFSDSRDVENAAKEGNELATLALEMYNDRVAKYIADYFVELEGNVDSIVFTAGVGENGIEARAEIINRLACLGIKLDSNKNSNIASYKEVSEGVISADDSKVTVEVLPTNEELMIIKDTYNIITAE